MKVNEARPRIAIVSPHAFLPRYDNFTEFLLGKVLDRSASCNTYLVTQYKKGLPVFDSYHSIPTLRIPRLFYSTDNAIGFAWSFLVSSIISIWLLFYLRPQYIISAHVRSNVFPLLFLAKLFGVKLAVCEHGLLHDEYIAHDRDDPLDELITHDRLARRLSRFFQTKEKLNFFAAYLRHWSLLHVHRIIFWSEYNRLVAEKLQLDAAKINCLKCFLDFSGLSAIHSGGLTLPEGKRIIFFIGQLKKRKGWEIYIEAASKIAASHEDVHFVLATSSNSESNLTKLNIVLSDCGMQEKMTIVANPTNEMRNYLYRKAQICVVPSYYEGFGLPALEAGYCGAIVVASKVPALTEFLRDGENSFLFKRGSAEDCAASIAKVLALDPQARAKLSVNMMATCVEYDVKNVTLDIKSLGF